MSEIIKYKESPLKMLLTAPTNYGFPTCASTPTTKDQINNINNTQTRSSPATDPNDDNSTKLITYFHQMSSEGEKEVNSVLLDHNYSRPWNWRPESSYIRPTKTLFIRKLKHSKQNSSVPLHSAREERDIIDVESVPALPKPVYDVEKARNLMEECDRFAALARSSEDNEDWEENISRDNWTTAQSRLFTSMVKILNSDRMGRLTYSGSWNEPVLRRTVIDKSVQRTRALMASISWDTKLTQWLHALLIDNLSASYLTAYLDILQTLKSKLPTFVEKMIFGPNTINRNGVTSNENLFPLLKRVWDPIGVSLIQDKPKRLPTNPIIIIAPSTLSTSSIQSKRVHKWTTLLSSLAHVITVNAQIASGGSRMTMPVCADQLLALTRTKVQDIRSECPNRPLILVGYGTGAAIVCQVAEVEIVAAVICLGFPLLTAEGRRGDADDILLDLQIPVLFVIGQNSHKTSREDMEDLRERMKIESGLVVVGSADDYLRVSKSKRRAEGITQSIVDRCILDEIADFVGNILVSPFPPLSRPQQAPYSAPTEHFAVKHIRNRRRNNSNGSSIESEPPSPQPLRSKPVGRPPGSGRKKLLQALTGSIGPQMTNPANYNSPMADPNTSMDSPTNILATHLRKSDTYHASNNPDVLNRAIQSITPVSTPSVNTGSQTVTNRPIMNTGSTLSNLLQNGVKSSPAPSSLRNALTSGINPCNMRDPNIPGKILTNNSRPFTLMTGGNVSRMGSISNIVLLPDGKKCIRTGPNLNIIQNLKPINNSQPVTSTLQTKPTFQLAKPSVGTIVNTGTPKLINRKPIMNKLIGSPDPQTSSASDLTTADIMDLPIIFADGDTNLLADDLPEEKPQTPSALQAKKSSTSKLVLINKNILSTNPSTPTSIQPSLKRTASAASLKSTQQMKYAKILMSKRAEDGKTQMFPQQRFKPVDSYQVTSIMPKKYDPPAYLQNIDLERDLIATTIPKPPTMLKALKDKPDTSPKKATITVDGKLTSVTLRSPISLTKSATPVSSTSSNSYIITPNIDETKVTENAGVSDNNNS